MGNINTIFEVEQRHPVLAFDSSSLNLNPFRSFFSFKNSFEDDQENFFKVFSLIHKSQLIVLIGEIRN